MQVQLLQNCPGLTMRKSAGVRSALKGWERSGMEAVERVRVNEAKRSVKYGSHEPVHTERAHHL
jgi:hypothetical protein